MSRYKLSFAKSRFVVDPARGTGAPETGDPPAGWGVQAKRGQIPRNHRQRAVSARGARLKAQGRFMNMGCYKHYALSLVPCALSPSHKYAAVIYPVS